VDSAFLFFMSNLIRLKKLADHWHFENEAHLELFVQSYVLEKLGLTILKKQYAVEGQICDLLAVDEKQQLAILELKNVEDRSLVQQITRYYDAVRRVQPFPEQVDYSQAIRLMAIAPDFHRDNHIDRQYSQLAIEFWRFKIIERANHKYLHLSNIETQQRVQAKIPYEESVAELNIPNPPKTFQNLIAQCDVPEQQRLLQLRDRLLRFDTRMQETVSGGSVVYGRSKSKPCAELRWDRSRACVVLYLWIPHVQNRGAKPIVARMRLWTDWQTISDLGHVPKGNGRKISVREWQAGNIRPLNKLLPRQAEHRDRFFTNAQYRHEYIKRQYNVGTNPHYRAGLALRFEHYIQLIGKPTLQPSLSSLVELALNTWLSRLSK
jgi:RecB family endonuclease NucS